LPAAGCLGYHAAVVPSSLRAILCLLLSAAYTAAAVVPCAPVLEDTEPGLPFAASAERVAAFEAALAAEPEVSIGAECPCGCEKKSPVRGSGTGFALPRPLPEAAFGAEGFEIASSLPAAHGAPDRLPEPVPI
jgi:hypothetical protein